jgi:tRNA(fMet)-specific endonuclease VapC
MAQEKAITAGTLETILPFHGYRLVMRYEEIRVLLESKGKTIGPLDMLIAAHALSLDLRVVSNNIKEFARISNVKIGFGNFTIRT